jgi:hypothetical protein
MTAAEEAIVVNTPPTAREIRITCEVVVNESE